MRKSFLDVDTEIKKEEGQTELADYRREKPPKKSPIMQILTSEKGNDAQTAEDMVMDSVGCTSNVVFIDS